jgi:hypothetical protein
MGAGIHTLFQGNMSEVTFKVGRKSGKISGRLASIPAKI